MTYPNQHEPAKPGKWAGGFVDDIYPTTENKCSVWFWSDGYPVKPVFLDIQEAVKTVDCFLARAMMDK